MARFRIPLTRPLAPFGAAAVVATLALGVGALPAAAAKKPPVSIAGKTTNEGVGKVKGGAVDVEADDFSFDKTFLKTTAGSVEVTVENDGNATHTFTVDGQDVDVQLAPGAKKTVMVEIAGDEPVVFYCRFHQGSGMQGAFFTKKGTSAATSGSGGSGSGGSYGY